MGQSGKGLVKWGGEKFSSLCAILTQERKENETEIDGLELENLASKSKFASRNETLTNP